MVRRSHMSLQGDVKTWLKDFEKFQIEIFQLVLMSPGRGFSPRASCNPPPRPWRGTCSTPCMRCCYWLTPPREPAHLPFTFPPSVLLFSSEHELVLSPTSFPFVTVLKAPQLSQFFMWIWYPACSLDLLESSRWSYTSSGFFTCLNKIWGKVSCLYTNCKPCIIQYGGHQLHVAPEHLKGGQSELDVLWE